MSNDKKRELTDIEKLRQSLNGRGWGTSLQYEIRKGDSVIPMDRLNQYALTKLLLLGEDGLRDFLLANITTSMSVKRIYSLTLHDDYGDDIKFNMTEAKSMALSYLLGRDNLMKSYIANNNAQGHHLLRKLKEYQDPANINAQIEGVNYNLSDEKLALIRDIIGADDVKLSLLATYHAKADKKYQRMNRNFLI